ncbi:hypothetical protein SEVIR_7G184250v4 [Setaria viridis]
MQLLPCRIHRLWKSWPFYTSGWSPASTAPHHRWVMGHVCPIDRLRTRSREQWFVSLPYVI